MQKHITYLLFIGFILACSSQKSNFYFNRKGNSQELNSQRLREKSVFSETHLRTLEAKLLFKNLITKVGYTCEETTEYSACAGNEIYVLVKINNNDISISEKTISSCDEEKLVKIGTYKWKAIKNEIVVQYPSKNKGYMYAKVLSLKIKEKDIIGKIKYPNGEIVEKIFLIE